MSIKFKCVLLLIGSVGLLNLQAQASESPPVHSPAYDSQVLIQAANDQIQIDAANGNTQTACDLFLIDVLNRAGFPIGHFLANDLDKAMKQHLPNWRMEPFSTDNVGEDQDVLRSFLNDMPDGTAFLAQWSRVGRSGHVALVEKVSKDHYMIFQAQMGLSLPHSSPARIQDLLYPKGAWGDRSHLRLFS